MKSAYEVGKNTNECTASIYSTRYDHVVERPWRGWFCLSFLSIDKAVQVHTRSARTQMNAQPIYTAPGTIMSLKDPGGDGFVSAF
jgi:hypothetical protein